MTLPTKEQFKVFTGEAIEAHFAGDVKNIDKRFERLMQQSYEIVKRACKGARITDLTDDELLAWQSAIMRQAEVIISKGDADLMEVSYKNISEDAVEYLREQRLWSYL